MSTQEMGFAIQLLNVKQSVVLNRVKLIQMI